MFVAPCPTPCCDAPREPPSPPPRGLPPDPQVCGCPEAGQLHPRAVQQNPLRVVGREGRLQLDLPLGPRPLHEHRSAMCEQCGR